MGTKQQMDIETLTKDIFVLRGQRVMLSTDLATLYGVERRALLQAVKRNRKRFPPDFMFQLTRAEQANLKSQSVISSSEHGGDRHAPYAFTSTASRCSRACCAARRPSR